MKSALEKTAVKAKVVGICVTSAAPPQRTVRGSVGGSLIQIMFLAAYALNCVLPPVHAQVAPLGPEFTVNTTTEGVQGNPALGAGANGNFIVAWTDGWPPDANGVFGQRFTATALAVGTEFQVSVSDSVRSGPAIAVAGDGDFVVAWPMSTPATPYDDIFLQRFASDGSAQGTELQVSTDGHHFGSLRFTPAAAAGNDGFVVAWMGYKEYVDDSESYGYGIFARRYVGDGSSLGTEFQVFLSPYFYPSYPYGGVDVGVAVNGNFIVVWDGYTLGSYTTIFARRYASSGVPLGTEFEVSSGDAYQPAVAVADNGDFVVVWADYYTYGGISMKRFASSGSALSGELQVNETSSHCRLFSQPDVAMSGDGDFVVVWSNYSYSDEGTSVLGRQFASDGTPRGSDVKISTSLFFGNDAYPAVAATGDEKFVVVWGNGYYHGYDISGQRLAPCEDESAELRAVRSRVAAECPCENFGKRGDYVRCARQVVKDAFANGEISRATRKEALRAARRSVCGRPGAVTCCRVNARGKSSCKVVKSAEKCRAPRGGSAGLGGSESCADACLSCDVVEPGPRYNEVRQKSVHNAYARNEALGDQLVYHRIRSLELDLHVNDAPSGDWRVYHDENPSVGPVPIPILDDEERTSCYFLSSCLEELATFHRAHPIHEVVTIFIELKDPLDAGHSAKDLDQLIEEQLSDALFRPEDLCPGVPSIRGAKDVCGWPPLAELRGKFIVVVNDSDHSGGTAQASYEQADPLDRATFFMADGNEMEFPCGGSEFAIFYNFADGNLDLARIASESGGFVTRTYKEDASKGWWNDAEDAKVHHIATNEVNAEVTPWATTANAKGWPFEVMDDPTPDVAENARVLSVRVHSGDIENHSDSFAFLASREDTNQIASWTASISVASSSIEHFAKGCLMARADTSPDAPYVAVCRPADDERPRIQWRVERGGDTEVREAPDSVVQEKHGRADHVSVKDVMFVRLLVLEENGLSPGRTCAVGYASRDEKEQNWTPIGEEPMCVNARLPLQGLAVSAHDNSSPATFVYSNATRAGQPYLLADFSEGLWGIGGGTAIDAIDGFLPLP